MVVDLIGAIIATVNSNPHVHTEGENLEVATETSSLTRCENEYGFVLELIIETPRKNDVRAYPIVSLTRDDLVADLNDLNRTITDSTLLSERSFFVLYSPPEEFSILDLNDGYAHAKDKLISWFEKHCTEEFTVIDGPSSVLSFALEKKALHGPRGQTVEMLLNSYVLSKEQFLERWGDLNAEYLVRFRDELVGTRYD